MEFDHGNNSIGVLDGTIQASFGDGSAEITTGEKMWMAVPFDCEITGYTLLADQVGSITIDIWKDTYADYPPTDADSITAAAPPSMSSLIKAQGVLTGWTTSLSKGDILKFNVDSITTCTRVLLVLDITRA